MSTLATQIPRTLIADDQPDVLTALRLLLKGAGYQTEAASSPKAVLEAIRTREFDVVLIDLNYTRDTTSGEEGLDLISCIQAEDASLPIVVMTAWGTVDVAVEAMRRGVRDFVQKPWENSRLLKIVETQIQSRRIQRRLRDQRRQRRMLRNRLRHEMAEAVDIQKALLPRRMPRLDGVQISTGWRPANSVSGDYFDVLQFSPDCVGFCIADVAGKGLPAALLMANLQATLKSCSSPDIPPGNLCGRINEIICENTSDRRFISFFYGLLDTEQRTFSYSNAGHNPPLLIREDGQWLSLRAGGGVLGVLPQEAYAQKSVTLAAGDRLVFFTDGLTEARNQSGEEFGEHRLLELLIDQRKLGAVELQTEAMQRVMSFCQGKFLDDVTLMVIAVE